jgi:sterol desaturase/sphingolipid hydroxylase (fatty acid hydroxylase superfamily)
MFPQTSLSLFGVLILRYLIIATIPFILFYGIRRRAWLWKKIQSKFPHAHDFRREIAYSVLTTLIFTGYGWVVFMSPLTSYTQVYFTIEEWGWGYFWGSVGFMLIVHDTYFYWTHRAMHHRLFFSWFHRVHHLSQNPSPWAAFAFHPLEALVEGGIIWVFAFLLPIHPLAVALFMLFMTIYNVYGHLGYELYPRSFASSFVGKWINTSVNHNQHHQYFKGNYGLYFLWWDRWMGTLREDYEHTFKEVTSRKKA